MILLIGGTSESVEVARELIQNQREVLVSVASSSGLELFKELHDVEKRMGKLDQQGFEALLKLHEIQWVIDASHPFAEQVSQTVMEAAKEQNIPYVRYERETGITSKGRVFSTYEEVCKYLQQKQGNILLTTGSNRLNTFLEYIPQERLYVRILPRVESLQAVEELGFGLDHIIAMKGPFSVSMNQELIQHWKIGYMVTKESGTRGGVEEKMRACEGAGIECLMIGKPKVRYTLEVKNMSALLNTIKEDGGLQ